MRDLRSVKIRHVRMLSRIASETHSAVSLAIELGISRATFYTSLNLLAAKGFIRMEAARLEVTEQGFALLSTLSGWTQTPDA